METSKDYKSEAIEAAKKAEVIIFCGGISVNVEDEEGSFKFATDGFKDGDRTHINLPTIQEDLLKELYKIGKPVVLINFSGSAMALNWEAQHLPAIVQGFYPGEATGAALTRLLFGDYSPSGRLPITFYKSLDDLPAFNNYQMEGRTYRYYKGEPLYKFGYGLSYTTFAYKNLHAPASVEAGKDAMITVEVSNTGKVDGEEVVQLYISNKTANVPVPVRTLAGFKSIFLKKGETKKVEFTLNPTQFSIINNSYNRVIEAGKFEITVGGSQPDSKSLASGKVVQSEINITGSKYSLTE